MVKLKEFDPPILIETGAPTKEEDEPPDTAPALKTPPKCGICKSVTEATNYCYGCGNYVCLECDWAEAWLWNRWHRIDDHLFTDEEERERYMIGGGV